MNLPLMGHHVLTPAYGREFRTSIEAIQSFEGGADWTLQHSPDGRSTYCSIRDFATGASAQLRYGRGLTKVTVVTVQSTLHRSRP